MKAIPCEVYSRVVGYYRPVHNWNLGKQQEFKDREEFSEKTPLENSEVKETSQTKTPLLVAGAIDSYKIFTLPNCDKCEEVKSFLKTKPFSGDVIDLKSPAGNKAFRTYYADKSIKGSIKRDEDGTLKLPIVFYMSKGNIVSTAQGLEAMSILA